MFALEESAMENQNAVKKILKECGIREFGFCDYSKVKGDLLTCRAKCKLKENTKTIISCAFPYKILLKEESFRNISWYAVVPDYHVIVKKILKNVVIKLQKMFLENYFDFFVDSSPIPEVKAAAYSGLGVQGDNGLLINPKYGSWVFLGEIVTDLELKCENHEVKSCLHCGKCYAACPNPCAFEDKTVCVSKISQQNGELTDFQQNLLKKANTVWGCDICQEACPLNQSAENTYLSEFKENVVSFVQLGDYEKLKDRAFQWRKKNVIERNIKLFVNESFNTKQ